MHYIMHDIIWYNNTGIEVTKIFFIYSCIINLYIIFPACVVRLIKITRQSLNYGGSAWFENQDI